MVKKKTGKKVEEVITSPIDPYALHLAERRAKQLGTEEVNLEVVTPEEVGSKKVEDKSTDEN